MAQKWKRATWKETVTRVLKMKKNTTVLLKKCKDDRILNFLKSKLKLNFTEVSFEDFIINIKNLV